MALCLSECMGAALVFGRKSLVLIPALQKLLEITAHFAGIKNHSNDVEAFCVLVLCEAGMVATVDWSCCFPDVYKTVAQYLSIHTALVSCACAHSLDLYATGFEKVPDPLDVAQREVNLMHSLGLVSDFELVWHHAKLDQERAEVTRERSFLYERTTANAMPQLGEHFVT
jgi:hypothetical protein